ICLSIVDEQSFHAVESKWLPDISTACARHAHLSCWNEARFGSPTSRGTRTSAALMRSVAVAIGYSELPALQSYAESNSLHHLVMHDLSTGCLIDLFAHA